MLQPNVAKPPTTQEIEQAKDTSRMLSKYANKKRIQSKILTNGRESEDLILPGSALNLLLDILTKMSKGNATTLMPVHAELTTQEAAGLLNVSRPYLIELLEKGAIPFRKVGTHRRLTARDIFQYKDKIDVERHTALEELTAQAQELKMGYDE